MQSGRAAGYAGALGRSAEVRRRARQDERDPQRERTVERGGGSERMARRVLDAGAPVGAGGPSVVRHDGARLLARVLGHRNH